MQRPPVPQWPQPPDNREPYDERASYPPSSNYPPQSIYPPPSNYPPSAAAAYPPPSNYPSSNYPPSSSYYSSSTYRPQPEPPSSAGPYFTHLDITHNESHSTSRNEFPSPDYRPPAPFSDPSAWRNDFTVVDDMKQEPEPPNVMQMQTSEVPRPTTELSPMDNPPNYRRAYWVIIVLANIYLLVGSILLIRLFYDEVYVKNTPAKVLFIAITVFEVLPRLLILFQLRKIDQEGISILLAAGILFGKKEVYLLFGKTKLSQQQIDRLAVMSDLICVLYIIWLGFAVIIDFGGVKSSHETDHRILILGISLAFSTCILVARVVWECIKHCCMKHKHEIQNDFDESVPDSDKHKKKEKKKEKKSKKKKKEKGREIGD